MWDFWLQLLARFLHSQCCNTYIHIYTEDSIMGSFEVKCKHVPVCRQSAWGTLFWDGERLRAPSCGGRRGQSPFHRGTRCWVAAPERPRTALEPSSPPGRRTWRLGWMPTSRRTSHLPRLPLPLLTVSFQSQGARRAALLHGVCRRNVKIKHLLDTLTQSKVRRHDTNNLFCGELWPQPVLPFSE